MLAGPITSCQGCGSGGLEAVIDFLPQPPVQAFLTPEQLGEPETHYPVALLRCPDCGLVQLGYAVDKTIVFPQDYPYQTGMTRILVEDFRDLADKAVEGFGLQAGALAVDIGSNDGTLLKGFITHGLRVLGIEPTDIARVAERNGVPTVQAYFDEDVARSIIAEHGQAAVVTATNVFAHIPNLFTKSSTAISEILGDDGVFVSESHYLLALIETLQYDTIYHEHLRLLLAGEHCAILLNMHGLEVFHASGFRRTADRSASMRPRRATAVPPTVARHAGRGGAARALAATRLDAVPAPRRALQAGAARAAARADGEGVRGSSASGRPSRGQHAHQLRRTRR